MSLQESLYNKSPEIVQNFFISLYGIKLYYERYLGSHKRYLNNLLKSQWLSKDELLENQTKTLRSLIRHAYNNVPYYNNLLKCKGLHYSDFKYIEDLKKFPLLEKDTIRNKTNELISVNTDRKKIIKLNTSGTTGKPLTIFVDLESRRFEYAFIARSHSWAGLTNGKNNVTFGGRTIVSGISKNNIFWRYNYIMDNYLFSSYHLSEKNLPYYINKIKKIRPTFIDSYPSSIYTLAKYMEENNIQGIHPKAIITSAETLLEHQRKTIEKVFQCKIYDQYGCTEQAVFISQCEKGAYHIHPEYGIIEIINENGDEVSAGEMGKIVCTGFTNMCMPLIRYDIGDMGIKGFGNCPCGRNFPVLQKIIGRKDDLIITPDGRKIGRLDPVFKGISSIVSAQIIQHNIKDVEIRIVPGKNYLDDDGDIIIKEMKKRLGAEMNIYTNIVTSIPKTNSGKFKSVLSKL